MKFKFYFILLVLIGIFFLSSCGSKQIKMSCGISENSQMGINHLQKVVDAMEKYKADHGKYPQNALDLTPQYLDKFPIVSPSSEGFDGTKYDVLQDEKLRGSGPAISDDGSSFKISIITKDDRICLLGGRNNICEYTSEKKVWSCYQ